jgi:hypothetical protein
MMPDVLAMSLVAVAILGTYGWLLSGAAVRHEAARGTSTAWEAVRVPPATCGLLQ